TYWRIHALRRIGLHRFDAWTDVATSQAFGKSGEPITWVVFNASDKPREVVCFEAGKRVATFTAAPRRLSVMQGGKVNVGADPMQPVPPAIPVMAETPISDGCQVSASSEQGRDGGVARAFDGDPDTRWTSRSTDSEWIAVDLGKRSRID